jgi:hypothetical protein
MPWEQGVTQSNAHSPFSGWKKVTEWMKDEIA